MKKGKKKEVLLDNFNLSKQVAELFYKASGIQYDLKEPSVSTLDFIIAFFDERDEKYPIDQFLLEKGILIKAIRVVNSILQDKQAYEELTGLDYDETFLQNEEESNSDDKAVIAPPVTPSVAPAESTDNDDNTAENITSQIQQIIMSYAQNYEVDLDYEITYTQELIHSLNEAATACLSSPSKVIDIPNLLYYILKNKNSSAVKFFEYINLDVKELLSFLNSSHNIYKIGKNSSRISIPSTLANSLSVFNDRFKKGQPCNILERDLEIEKLWNIFSKKTKRNAILYGEPGVGKTSIIEAITMSIVNGTCPDEFKDYTVLSLDLLGMMSNTKFRGEFEQKLFALIEIIEDNDNIILFIDEIHQLLGSGSTNDGGVDMAGGLKPILARDSIICVGATTTEDYERAKLRDPAFMRRFEPVYIKEPKLSKVSDMLKLKVKELKKYHGVNISSEMVDYCITCASCFNFSLANPDKSLDLIDRSIAKAKQMNKKNVTKAIVDSIHKEAYDKFEKASDSTKLQLASHEAGHYLMTYLSPIKLHQTTVAVSVIPADDFYGAHIYEEDDDIIMESKDYIKNKIMILLAGRIGEEIMTGSVDIGAANDLARATNYAVNMITRYGMDTNVRNLILQYEGSNEYLFNSDSISEEVRKAAALTITKLTENTKEILTKNKKKLELITNLLISERIVSGERLEKLLEDDN